jgi:hypothetical protein
VLSTAKFKSILFSFTAALLITLFAYSGVYREIEKLRFKLLESPIVPARNGAILFRFPNPRPYEARILAARINNNSDQSKTFTIKLNETEISSLSIQPAATETQVVYVPQAAICARCKLFVSSDHTAWELQTVEVRNMYGFSSAWIKAVVVNHDSQSFSKFKPLELLLIFLLTFLVLIRTSTEVRSKLWLIPAIIILIGAIALTIVPFISSYKVLLSPTAFTKLWILCFIPFWISSYQTLSARKNFKAILAAAIVCTILTGGMLRQLIEYDGNFSGFLHVSKKFLGRNYILGEHPEIRRDLIKVDGNGYDGQFFYFITWDPLMKLYHFAPGADKVVDDPVFRYRRIAYPVFTKIFSLNQPYLFPTVMMLLLIAGGTILSFFIARIATDSSGGWMSLPAGLLAVFIPGIWFSLSVATPEPLAAAFLAGGFFLTLQKRYTPAAIFFALAALTRESTILFIVVIAIFEFLKQRKIRAPLILFASIVPYFAWRLYVTATLNAMRGWKGFFFEPGNVGVPFAGVIQTYQQIMNGKYIEVVTKPAIALPIVLICMVIAFIFIYGKTKNPVAIIGAIYAFLALSLSYNKVWADVSNVERQSYESFLCLILLFASMTAEQKGKIAIYAGVAVVVIYDLFFMIRTTMFYAGLTWLFKI